MMVMLVIVVADQFIARDGIAEIEALHQFHFLQQMHGTVDRSQVALGGTGERVDFPDGQRVSLGLERRNDRASWSGQFARFLTQPISHRKIRRRVATLSLRSM
jgi:hypothetical protein